MQQQTLLHPRTARVLGLLVVLNTLPLLSGHPTIIELAEQRSDCEGCGDLCDKCKYGSEISLWCGVRECLKGPGEPCGGVGNKYGNCGDGMYCRCKKCTGCSVETLECFSAFCPENDKKSLHQRSRLHSLGSALDK